MAAHSSVAVVIPCFNGRSTLAEAIDSALIQDHVDEIVVVDDGSTDGSAALASSYGGKVNVLVGANGGVSLARNRGIEATHAPLVQFLDADDILLPGTLALRVKAFEASSSDVVVTDWLPFQDEAGSRHFDPVRSAPFDDLSIDAELSCMTRFWAPPAAILYSRAIVERAGGFRADHWTLEDARFLFDVARVGARFHHEAHEGALYRIHAGSKSRSDPRGFWMTALRKAVEVEAEWSAAGTFTERRRERLADVYNGVVAGLFHAAAPEFRQALQTADEKGVRLTTRNRLARILAGSVGLGAARRIAQLYTAARRRARDERKPEGAA